MTFCMRCNERMDEDRHLCRECIGDLVLIGLRTVEVKLSIGDTNE